MQCAIRLTIWIKSLRPELEVGVGDFVWFAVFDDFSVVNKNGAGAEAADIFHGMGDKDDSLVVVLEAFEILVAFLLEGGVADGEDLVEKKNVAAGADGNGKGEADLHAGRIIFKFLVLEIFELGEFPNIVVHFVHFGVRKAEQSAI